MIGLRDAAILTWAKIRSKKVLLLITLFLPGVLYGVFVTALMVGSGISDSARLFTSQTQGGQYLVKAEPVIPHDVLGVGRVDDVPEELKQQLLGLEEVYISERESIASEYGVDFDPESVVSVLKEDPFGRLDSEGAPLIVVDTSSPVWQVYANQKREEWVRSAPNTRSQLESLAGSYGAVGYYEKYSASTNYATTSYLEGGAEDLSMLGQHVAAESPYIVDLFKTSVRNASFTFIDQSVVSRFILPENTARRESSGVPVVVTIDEAVAMFGDQLNIANSPNDPVEKVEWLKSVQDKVNGTTFQMCYRSQDETRRVATALRQSQERAGQGDDYAEPQIAYSLPTDTCGLVQMSADNRTTAEIARDAELEEYYVETGQNSVFESELMTFQIVGLMDLSSVDPQLGSSIQEASTALLAARVDSGAFIPLQMYEELSEDQRHEAVLRADTDSVFVDASITPVVVAFPDASSARSFIESEGCAEYATSCDRNYRLSVYGSNYLLISDITRSVERTLIYIALSVLAVILIVMIVTMTRLIIDSQKETAVFRAIGANRSDIMTVYLLYGLFVAVCVPVIGLAVGSIASWVLDWYYSGSFTAYAQYAFGVVDDSSVVRLYGMDWSYFAFSVAAIIAVSIIAIVIALLRVIRRNPIKDLRDQE